MSIKTYNRRFRRLAPKPFASPSVIVCSPPKATGTLPAAKISSTTSLVISTVLWASIDTSKSPASCRAKSSTSIPLRKLYVSIFKDACLIACGANLAPLRYVLVASKGTPKITYRASSNGFLHSAENVGLRSEQFKITHRQFQSYSWYSPALALNFFA